MLIKTKIIVMTIGLSVIPIILISLLFLNMFESEITKVISESALEINQDLVSELQNDLTHDMELGIYFSRTKELVNSLDSKDQKIPELSSYLSEFVSSFQSFITAYLINPQGQIIASSHLGNTKEQKGFFETAKWFDCALRGETVCSEIGFDPNIKQYVMNCYIPVNSVEDKGKVIAVLVLGLDWNIIDNSTNQLLIRGEEQKESTHLMVTDMQGNVVSCFDQKNKFDENLIDAGLISAKNARDGKCGVIVEISEHGLKSFSAYLKANLVKGYKSPDYLFILLQDYNEIFAPVYNLQKYIILISLILIILVIIVSYIMATKFSNPIKKITSATKKVAAGDLTSTEISNISSRDEIGELSKSFTAMTSMLRKQKKTDDEQKKIDEARNWTFNAVEKIRKILREGTAIDSVSNNICSVIAELLNAQMTAYYSIKENSLLLTGSYAVSKDKKIDIKKVFEIGEGLIGQAVKEKNIITVTNIPTDSSHINSALGNALPTNITVQPFVYKNSVVGVIELGSFTKLTDLHIGFLKTISESTALSLINIENSIELQKLLKQAQSQTEELQVQQEELEARNEELQAQQQELKDE